LWIYLLILFYYKGKEKSFLRILQLSTCPVLHILLKYRGEMFLILFNQDSTILSWKNREKDPGGEIPLPIDMQMLRIDGTSVIVEGRGVRTCIDGKPAIQITLRERLCTGAGRNSIQHGN